MPFAYPFVSVRPLQFTLLCVSDYGADISLRDAKVALNITRSLAALEVDYS